MTVQEMLDRLGKLPPNLIVKHHTSSGFVRDIKDCRIVSDERNVVDDNPDSDIMFVCIY